MRTPTRAILDYIEIGKEEGRLMTGGGKARRQRIFIQPTVSASGPDARITQEEIFGPVLALVKAKDFEDGLGIANNTEYGLTGSLFRRGPRRSSKRHGRIPRGQPVLQPQVHRRSGGGASVRRLQHVRHRLQGRRLRLPAPLHPGEAGVGGLLITAGFSLWMVFKPHPPASPGRWGFFLEATGWKPAWQVACLSNCLPSREG